MKYKTWYDVDNEVLYLKTFTQLTAKDIEELLPQIDEHFEGKHHRYILADMSENSSGFVDREARKLLKARSDAIKFDKMAVIGARPATRMVTKVALKILGKSDVSQFHKTEKEALAWFKQRTEIT